MRNVLGSVLMQIPRRVLRVSDRRRRRAELRRQEMLATLRAGQQR